MDYKCGDEGNGCEKCCCLCQTPGKINYAVLSANQTVLNQDKVSLLGNSYQNEITLTSPYTINFPATGMYKVDFIISSAITQAGPLNFQFMVDANADNNFGAYSGGIVNSTTSGLQVSGTGFVKITKAPTTAYLQNSSGQTIDITYLRLNIIKIS